jgi:hypothetical protein
MCRRRRSGRKQGDDRFFQECGRWGMLCLGHLVLLWSGLRMALFLAHPTTQHTSRGLLCPIFLFTILHMGFAAHPFDVVYDPKTPVRSVRGLSNRFGHTTSAQEEPS